MIGVHTKFDDKNKEIPISINQTSMSGMNYKLYLIAAKEHENRLIGYFRKDDYESVLNNIKKQPVEGPIELFRFTDNKYEDVDVQMKRNMQESPMMSVLKILMVIDEYEKRGYIICYFKITDDENITVLNLLENERISNYLKKLFIS